MKKTLLLTLLALLGMTQAMAQDYEYVPFVREGIKWVYYFDYDWRVDGMDLDWGIHYYSFEMKGDVQIGDKHYKQVCLTHYLEDGSKEVEDFIPVYLREEDKVVYALYPEGQVHLQCPVAIKGSVSSSGFSGYGVPYGVAPFPADAEFVLYDFNNPAELYDSIFAMDNLEVATYLPDLAPAFCYLYTDTLAVGNHHSKRHYFHNFFAGMGGYSDGNDEKIIEGIGYDGVAGMPLFYFEKDPFAVCMNYCFSHVIEDDNIIYEGRYYDPGIHVGIDEVATDVQLSELDGNYYNLMGQPCGTEVPTTPGIYIHQGKKTIVR